MHPSMDHYASRHRNSAIIALWVVICLLFAQWLGFAHAISHAGLKPEITSNQLITADKAAPIFDHQKASSSCAALDAATFNAPSVPVISNVTAQPHAGVAEIKARLVDQVTSSVHWEESIRHLLAQGFTRFIELGPGSALTGFMKRIDKTAQALNVADIASLDATVAALAT